MGGAAGIDRTTQLLMRSVVTDAPVVLEGQTGQHGEPQKALDGSVDADQNVNVVTRTEGQIVGLIVLLLVLGLDVPGVNHLAVEGIDHDREKRLAVFIFGAFVNGMVLIENDGFRVVEQHLIELIAMAANIRADHKTRVMLKGVSRFMS